MNEGVKISISNIWTNVQEIADLHNLHPLVKSYLKVDMISSTRRYKKNKALADQKACTPATEANIKTCILVNICSFSQLYLSQNSINSEI